MILWIYKNKIIKIKKKYQFLKNFKLILFNKIVQPIIIIKNLSILGIAGPEIKTIGISNIEKIIIFSDIFTPLKFSKIIAYKF